jgi:para-aminobenzoate synthetase/4-amino-4-deoxychorismate lyase
MRGIFVALITNQEANYSAYILTDKIEVSSASPELFFELDGERLTSKPMKGTSPRGLTYADDERRIDRLRDSEKERAENLMIVDMVRNDLGRIARPGSVTVPSLFDVERYPTVLQMTSTVSCSTDAGFAEIIEATFPCASVTGAPKVRTMEIIRELEKEPRGVYTGSIGYLLPGRRARFSVAIRTVSRHVDENGATYGIGSGVVWDSNPEAEYDECLLKAAVITTPRPEFDLLETMLWESESGFFLLDRHLKRISCSAVYFGYPLDIRRLESELEELAEGFREPSVRIRVLVSRDGVARFETAAVESPGQTQKKRIGLAEQAVSSHDIFLYHKTTHREVYDRAMGSQPFDDVVLFNERREVTESTIANVVVEIDGKWLTPPVDCGLLAGTFREELLDKSEIEEHIVSVEELPRCERIFLINSVQKWIPCVLEL